MLEARPASPPPAPALEPAAEPAADAPPLSFAQWRALVRLCRAVESADPITLRLLGPQARAWAHALREAQAAWRRRGDPAASPTSPPLPALAAVAVAALGFAQRVRARPVGYFTPPDSALGQGLLLKMPAMKAWLQTGFAQAAAVPADASPAQAVARAGDAVVRQCLALCGADDGFERRGHLVQLLNDHGHREPLLRLVRQAGGAWLPKDWAAGWEQLTGTGQDKAAIDALQAAMAKATPKLARWAQEPKPAAPPPLAMPAAEVAATSQAVEHPALAPSAGRPVILRAAQLPRRLLWGCGAAAALALAVGLALHLTAGNGVAKARWVIYHADDVKTMAIDPESIRRDGRYLTYRVGVVRSREQRSSVAVFTTDCATTERRLETVQHYSGANYDTATRYEVRGTPAGTWPPSGADVALLRAACAQR